MHFVEELANLFEIGESCAVWVKGICFVGARWKRIDEEFGHATGMDLKMKAACYWVLPELDKRISMSRL